MVSPVDYFRLNAVGIDGNLHKKVAHLKLTTTGDIEANAAFDFVSRTSDLKLNLGLKVNHLPFVNLPLGINANLKVQGLANQRLRIDLENLGVNAHLKSAWDVLTNTPY